MTLQQLRDFLAVAERGSIRAAARTLSVSQPALTKSIGNLERSLRVTLFQRTTLGITLTAYGKAFLARASAILRECQQAEQLMAQLRGMDEGSVAFGISTAPSILLAPSVIAEFRRRHPKGVAHLTSGLSHTLLPAVRDGSLDFAIVPLPKTDESKDLTVTKLFKSDPVVVSRRGHPLANCSSLSDLVDADWLVLGTPSPAGNPQGSIVDLFMQQGLGMPRIAVTSDSLADSLNILYASDLIAPLPRLVLEMPGVRELLLTINLRETLPQYDICAVHRPSVPLAPLARELVSMFVSRAKLPRARPKSTGR